MPRPKKTAKREAKKLIASLVAAEKLIANTRKTLTAWTAKSTRRKGAKSLDGGIIVPKVFGNNNCPPPE